MLKLAERSHDWEQRHFSWINGQPRIGKYVFVERYDLEELDRIQEVDLEKILLWEPNPREWFCGHGVWSAVKRASRGKVALGLTFAEAMIDQPWPEQWREVGFIGCAGTIIECSPGVQRPVYACLERNRYSPTKVAIRWRSVDPKVPKSLRVAFYPTEN